MNKWRLFFLWLWLTLAGVANAFDKVAEAFYAGDANSTIRLADEQILNAQRQSDARLLADGLFWRGVASAAQSADINASQTWGGALDAARRANARDEEVLILGTLALDSLTNLNAALKAARTGDGGSVSNGILLNLLGIAAIKQAPAPARRAFEISLELLQKNNVPAAEQAVAQYNLAVTELRLAENYSLNEDLNATYQHAREEFEKALAKFQSGANTFGMACCQFQLAWAAFEMGDDAGVDRCSAELRQLVGKLKGVDPRGVERLRSAYLVFTTSSSTPKITTVATAEIDTPNSGMARIFDQQISGIGALASSLVEDKIEPLKKFMWLWHYVYDPANAGSATTVGNVDELIVPGMPDPSQMEKELEQKGIHLTDEQKRKMQDSLRQAKERLRKELQTNPEAQQAMRILKSMNQPGDPNVFGQQEDIILNQLPGGAKLQAPAGPLTMLADARTGIPNIASIPGLDTDKQLPQGVLGSVWSWGLGRRIIYGEDLTSKVNHGRDNNKETPARGLTYAGMSLSATAQNTLQALVQAGENRAAWQVVEETRAAPGRVESQLKEALTQPAKKSLRQDLIAAQEKGIDANMEYVRERQNTAGDDVNMPDRAGLTNIQKLWEASQASYDMMYSRAVKDNFKEVPPLMTAAEAANAMPSEAVYVSFSTSLMLDNGYVFLLDPRKNKAQPDVLVEKVSLPLALIFRFQQTAYRENSTMDEFPNTGRRLFDRLFPGAVGERIHSASRIILSPPSRLWSFPFAALVINDSNTTPSYLGLAKAVSYTESMAQFKQCRDHLAPSTVQSGDALIIGGIPYNQAGQKPVYERFQCPTLPELTESAREAKEVAAVYGAQAVTGDTATESLVRSRIERAPIIHIATHGYKGNTFPAEDAIPTAEEIRKSLLAGTPGIWLCARMPATKPGFSEDGLLQAWEVESQLNLKAADLVVFSACDVGQAKSMMNYGPELPLASLRAGAASVIAVQAAANDRSTAWFMLQFHKLVKQGIRKDEALRQTLAQVHSQGKFQHPVYWAPFILLGDPDNRLFAKK